MGDPEDVRGRSVGDAGVPQTKERLRYVLSLAPGNVC